VIGHLKGFVKALPFVKEIFLSIYERKFSKANNGNLFRGVYGTFDEALKSAPSTKPLGYDHEAPASMYLDRLIKLHSTDYPILFWLKDIVKETKSLTDFGGHIGVGYYCYKDILGITDDFQWVNYDVSAVTEEGRELAINRGVKNITFTSNFSGIENIETLMASGSLQYLKENIWETVAKHSNKPKHILINMLPIHDGHEFFTLQNIGTAFCPYRIYNRNNLIHNFENLGYQLIDYWTNPEKSCYIPLKPNHSQYGYHGMYLKLSVIK